MYKGYRVERKHSIPIFEFSARIVISMLDELKPLFLLCELIFLDFTWISIFFIFRFSKLLKVFIKVYSAHEVGL